MQTILIAGGTGLIGSELSAYFLAKGYTIKLLSRRPTDEAKGIFHWNIKRGVMDLKALNDVNYVINLTGSSIIGGRWTDERKKYYEILE